MTTLLKTVSIFGLLVAILGVWGFGHQYMALDAAMLRDVAFPNCRWITGECDDVYVTLAIAYGFGVISCIGLAAFSVAGLFLDRKVQPRFRRRHH